MVDFEPATREHALIVAQDMREADRLELDALSGESPEQATVFSVVRSDFAFFASVGGDPICIFGVGSVSLLGRVGAPWLLGTCGVERHYRKFARQSVDWRDRMLDRYSVLTNVIDDRNELTKRWLTWLGAEFSAPVSYGVKKCAARIFELRA